jgi:hypothetical protein
VNRGQVERHAGQKLNPETAPQGRADQHRVQDAFVGPLAGFDFLARGAACLRATDLRVMSESQTKVRSFLTWNFQCDWHVILMGVSFRQARR